MRHVTYFTITSTPPQCPHCGSSKIILDPVNLEVVCISCGTVIDYVYMFTIPRDQHDQQCVNVENTLNIELPGKLYSVLNKLAVFLNVDRRVMRGYLCDEYVHCRRLVGKDVFKCTLARAIARVALSKSINPAMLVQYVFRNVLGFRRGVKFVKILEYVRDYQLQYINHRAHHLRNQVKKIIERFRVNKDVDAVLCTLLKHGSTVSLTRLFRTVDPRLADLPLSEKVKTLLEVGEQWR